MVVDTIEAILISSITPNVGHCDSASDPRFVERAIHCMCCHATRVAGNLRHFHLIAGFATRHALASSRLFPSLVPSSRRPLTGQRVHEHGTACGPDCRALVDSSFRIGRVGVPNEILPLHTTAVAGDFLCLAAPSSSHRRRRFRPVTRRPRRGHPE